VLIFSATVGGGHATSARAVAREVEHAGHQSVTLDGLDVMSQRLKWCLTVGYSWQLTHMPWSYGMSFQFLGRRGVARGVRRLIGHFWGDRLQEVIEKASPDVIVSTYPVVTAGLGQLIESGRLDVPVVAVLTDFDAHALWVSPHVDLHLVPSRATQQCVEANGIRSRVMSFPVDPRFRSGMPRPDARRALDLPADAVIPLIIGGAWGVGDLEGATACAIEAGTFPVVITATNADLRRRLERQFPDPGKLRIVGWTDELPTFMAAADCLVQNAGGVTCLEAIAARLPIVFFRPIPGHGIQNARVMRHAGAARVTRRASELRRLLSAVDDLQPLRNDQGCDVADAILGLAACLQKPAMSGRR
jgi:UDP-N-acetylglucosamine:LPS N-acetylglucosamine transferase